ncbi:hypothetical protein AB1K18_26190 [Peribacillus simplex]|uniref:hypothetical protein n=1 Tax=Peribacillus simplex TaxID=1478 RepID=UPI003B8E12AB
MFFYFIIVDETLTGLMEFAILLPNNWLAWTTQDACFDAAWQTVGGKDLRISENNWTFFREKL